MPSSRIPFRGEGSLFLSHRPSKSKPLQSKATSSPKLHQSPAHAPHAGQKPSKPAPQIPASQKPKAPPKSADQKTNSGNPPKRRQQIPRTREQTPHYSVTRQTKIPPAPRPQPHPNIPPTHH